MLGLLIAVASLVAKHRLQGAWASAVVIQVQQWWLTGSRMQAQKLWHVGLTAPQYVESSQTKD